MQPQTQPVAEPVELLDEVQPESLLEQAMNQPLALENAKFDFVIRHARVAADSQYFKDAAAIPQAAMKIMAGEELGLPPVASLMHVNVIKGKVSLDGNLIATLLRRGGYSWQPIQHDENGAEFLFLKDGKPMTQLRREANGFIESPLTISFTRKDAEKAQLTGKVGDKGEPSMYDKYPRNMFFNRVITNFQRWHAPEVSNGITVYTPEELADGGDPAPTDTPLRLSIKVPTKTAEVA